MGLGWARSKQDAYSAAAALLEVAIALFRDVGMKQLLAFASSLLAEVAYAQGEDGQAVVSLEDSMTLFGHRSEDRLAMALRILAPWCRPTAMSRTLRSCTRRVSPYVGPSGTSTASRSAWRAPQMSP